MTETLIGTLKGSLEHCLKITDLWSVFRSKNLAMI